MAWAPQSLVDFFTNTLWSPIRSDRDAAERPDALKPSKASGFPSSTNPVQLATTAPRIPAERPVAIRPTKNVNSPLVQLRPPQVVKITAHDPVQKFFLGTRFVKVTSLGKIEISAHLEAARRFSLIATPPAVSATTTTVSRFLLLEGTRRYSIEQVN